MAYRSRGFNSVSFGFGAPTPVVKRLLVANVVVFVAGWIVGERTMIDWFGFHAGTDFLLRPWGAVTYMFVHGGFGHILVNMLFLFFFGPPLESKWGGSEFLRFYFVAGLGGAALGFFFAGDVPVVGASGAVYGVLLAFAMNWPDARIWVYAIFPVKAKWLVLFAFVVSLFSTFAQPGSGVAHFAHLGGLLAAFVYLRADVGTSSSLQRLKRSARDMRRRMAIISRDEDDGPDRSRTRRSAREDESDRWSPQRERELLDQVDRVLDKISKEGMGSLSEEERRILDEASRRHNTN